MGDRVTIFLVLAGVILLSVLTAVCAAAYARRRTLRGLKALAKEILPETDACTSPEQVVSILCRAAELQEANREQELHRNREFMISRFLADHSGEAEILDLQARAKLLLHSDTLQMYGHWFTALYVIIDNVRDVYGSGAAPMDYTDSLALIRSTLEAAVGRTEVGYCVEDQGGHLCLINFRDTDSQTTLAQLAPRNRALLAACGQAVEQIRGRTGLICRTALAEPFWDIRELRRVSDELQTLLDYESLTGSEKSVVTFDDTSFREVQPEAAMKWERAFFEAMVSRDLPQARTALEGILHMEEQGGLDSIRRVRQKMCMRLRIAADVYGCLPEQADDMRDALLQMEHMSSFAEMRKIAFGVMDLLEPQAQTISRSSSQALVQYVTEHYSDPELSLMLLADRFGMSQSGVSRAVKNITGERMVDYVHGLRIAEAKQLLENTELTVYEICDRVGYNTSWTMTRAFKRYTGMTPGAWREQAQKTVQ